jgi:hypothetical protein
MEASFRKPRHGMRDAEIFFKYLKINLSLKICDDGATFWRVFRTFSIIPGFKTALRELILSLAYGIVF